MTETGVAPPKQGELVSRSHQEGIFEVVGVNALMHAANIRGWKRARHTKYTLDCPNS
jgi:hypothetical protein